MPGPGRAREEFPAGGATRAVTTVPRPRLSSISRPPPRPARVFLDDEKPETRLRG